MKIYLAGPMRGYDHFNFPAFDLAAEMLRGQGHEVFSPADNDRAEQPGTTENNKNGDTEAASSQGFSLRKALRQDTSWICNHADAIAMLPGWEKSAGATAEHALAKALSLTIIILGKEYVDGKPTN